MTDPDKNLQAMQARRRRLLMRGKSRRTEVAADVEVKKEPKTEDVVKNEHENMDSLEFRSMSESTNHSATMESALSFADAEANANSEVRETGLEAFIREAKHMNTLKKGHRLGLATLKVLKEVLDGNLRQSYDYERLREMIEEAQTAAKQPTSLIAIVGATGSGKTSLLNSILDQERLLPISSMRACTSAAIIVRYNYDDDIMRRFKLMVEFVSVDEWRDILEQGAREALDQAAGHDAGDQITTQAEENEDTGALGKIKAVYPDHPLDNLDDLALESLLDADHVQNVLGTKLWRSHKSLRDFKRELRAFVDGKPKWQKDARMTMAYWPLIKQVTIYHKSEVLANGAMLCDTPGLLDEAVGRSNVASDIMAYCDHLWVVAPMIRALDDKTSKDLYGSRFRRQLKMDGSVDKVAFICSKTDQIHIDGTAQELPNWEDIKPSFNKVTLLDKEKKRLDRKRKGFIQKKREATKESESQKRLSRKWSKWLAEHREGVPVPYPKKWKKCKKRGADTAHGAPAAKKPRSQNDLAGLDTQNEVMMSQAFPLMVEDSRISGSNAFEPANPSSAVELEATNNGVGSSTELTPQEDLLVEDDPNTMSEHEIQCVINDADTAQQAALEKAATFEENIAELTPMIANLQAEIEELKPIIHQMCIQGRNEVARRRIPEDYAEGLRETDQEVEAENDLENFDPTVDSRDYSALAQRLQVACVSSNSYQAQCGRMKHDKPPIGFFTKAETGIPQLQSWCRGVTEGAYRKCLETISACVNSVEMWASVDSSTLSTEKLEYEMQKLDEYLDLFRHSFGRLTKATQSDIHLTLQTGLYDRFPRYINKAIKAVETVVAQWHTPGRQGGLPYATYRAIINRNGGPFSGKRGNFDFNKDLSSEIERLIAHRWDATFRVRLPKHLQHLGGEMKGELAVLSDRIEELLQGHPDATQTLQLLRRLSENANSRVDIMTKSLGDLIADKQKEINRRILSTIKAEMSPAYQFCATERGKGCFKRMQDALAAELDKGKRAMFTSCMDKVHDGLEEMVGDIKAQMEKHKKLIMSSLEVGSQAIFAGQEEMTVSEDEIRERARIAGMLNKIHNIFEKRVEAEEQDAESRRSKTPQSEDEEADDTDDADLDHDSSSAHSGLNGEEPDGGLYDGDETDEDDDDNEPIADTAEKAIQEAKSQHTIVRGGSPVRGPRDVRGEEDEPVITGFEVIPNTSHDLVSTTTHKHSTDGDDDLATLRGLMLETASKERAKSVALHTSPHGKLLALRSKSTEI